jgi:hypothetical protein
LGNRGGGILARSTTLTGLTTLALSQCDVGPSGCGELLSSSVTAGLKNLHFGGCARTPTEGAALAGFLAESPHLGRLEMLSLDQTAITDWAAAQLARADLPALKSLVLLPHDRNHSDTPTGLPRMTATGLAALIATPWFAGLEELDLSGHALGDVGARDLAEARLPRLRNLTLMRTGLTPAGLRELIAAYAGQLDHLQLAGNPLGDAGAEHVASTDWPRMVPRPGKSWFDLGLYLASCEIGDRGARALLESETIPVEIPSLFLGRCAIDSELIAALKAKYMRATIQF